MGAGFGASRERRLQSLPAVKNWIVEGKVTPIRDQGSCGE